MKRIFWHLGPSVPKSPGLLFCLALLSRVLVCHAQVTEYDVFASGQWFQTSDNPSFSTGNAYGWFAAGNISLQSSTDADSATLVPGGPSTFALSKDTPTHLSFSTTYYGSRSALEADFPTGATYTYALVGGTYDSSQGTISIPASPPYPSTIPAFANFSSFSAIDPNSATFQWNSWSSAPSSPSGIFFDVRSGSSVVYSTFLQTSATSFTVPTGILQPNQSYSAEVIFSSRLNSGIGTWGSVDALAGWDYRTSADFTTVPEPAESALAVGLLVGAFALVRRFSRSHARA
jgi:hypothetical protein